MATKVIGIRERYSETVPFKLTASRPQVDRLSVQTPAIPGRTFGKSANPREVDSLIETASHPKQLLHECSTSALSIHLSNPSVQVQ